jgi:hypothetical protein
MSRAANHSIGWIDPFDPEAFVACCPGRGRGSRSGRSSGRRGASPSRLAEREGEVGSSRGSGRHWELQIEGQCPLAKAGRHSPGFDQATGCACAISAAWLKYHSGYAIAFYILVSAVITLVAAAMMKDYTGKDIEGKYE